MLRTNMKAQQCDVLICRNVLRLSPGHEWGIACKTNKAHSGAHSLCLVVTSLESFS